MSEPLTPQEEFRRKMVDRIRADIGDLLPDAMLRDIISESIRDMFQQKAVDQWGNRKSRSWLEETLRDLIWKSVQTQIQIHMKENAEELNRQIKAVFEQSVAELLMRGISQTFHNEFYNLQTAVESRFKQIGGY